MKKIIMMLLVLMTSVCVLSGCGGYKGDVLKDFPMGMTRAETVKKADKEFGEKNRELFKFPTAPYRETIKVDSIEDSRYIVYEVDSFWDCEGEVLFTFDEKSGFDESADEESVTLIRVVFTTKPSKSRQKEYDAFLKDFKKHYGEPQEEIQLPYTIGATWLVDGTKIALMQLKAGSGDDYQEVVGTYYTPIEE